jgi:hypothetical protein
MMCRVSPNESLTTIEIILYFNLPYNPIIKEKIEPIKIFPKGNQAQSW